MSGLPNLPYLAEVAPWPGGSAERSGGHRLRRGRFEAGTARRQPLWRHEGAGAGPEDGVRHLGRAGGPGVGNGGEAAALFSRRGLGGDGRLLEEAAARPALLHSGGGAEGPRGAAAVLGARGLRAAGDGVERWPSGASCLAWEPVRGLPCL